MKLRGAFVAGPWGLSAPFPDAVSHQASVLADRLVHDHGCVARNHSPQLVF